MKQTKIMILAMVAFLTVASRSSAQDYSTGIGARLGGLSTGLTIKHFIAGNAALEGIVSFGPSDFNITGLYEIQKDISGTKGLSWFYGIGGHVGFFRYGDPYYVQEGHHVYVVEQGGTATVIGIDFILGIEYKFTGAPFSVALDMKPFVDFNDGAAGYFDGALSVRYAF